MSLFSTFDIAGSALSAQSLRLNLTASNLANMHDVAGDPAKVYHARDALFRAREPNRSAGVLAGAANVLGGSSKATRRPSSATIRVNPQANADGIVYSANVNAMEEMANMISASRSYQSNLEVINTAKDLMLRTLSLGQG